MIPKHNQLVYVNLYTLYDYYLKAYQTYLYVNLNTFQWLNLLKHDKLVLCISEHI